MKTKVRLLTVAAAALTLVVLGVIAGHSFLNRSPLDRNFPVQRQTRVLLPTASESVRVMHYYDDRTTPKDGVEFYADGSEAHYWFRRDGTLSHADVVGKADDSGKRPKLRVTSMAADGVTFVSDDEWYPDGNVKKQVALEPDGVTMTRVYFYDNGQTERNEVIKRDGKLWTLFTQYAFREDGSRQRTFTTDNGVVLDTTFLPSELPSVVKRLDTKSDTYTEKWYHDDGRTLSRKVDQDSSGTAVSIYRADGTVAQSYHWYGPVKAGMLELTVFDEHGRKSIAQTWFFNQEGLWLRAVDVFDAAGHGHHQFLFDQGKGPVGRIERETTYQSPVDYSGARTVRSYRDDGTLSSVEKFNNNGDVVSKEEHTPADAIVVQFDSKLLQVAVPYLPPQKIEFVAED